MFKPTKKYRNWLQQLKERIRSSQIKAALKVNAELLNLYWDLGKEILDKEKNATWGDKLILQLSKDLLAEFPEIKGFSRRNLFYIKRFVEFYKREPKLVQQAVAQIERIIDSGQQPVAQIVSQPAEQVKKNKLVQQTIALKQEMLPQVMAALSQQAVDKIPSVLTTIPWGHHLQIITKCKKINEALFYISETTQNNWSRSVLVHQLESSLYKRKGKAISNFDTTLPKPQSDQPSIGLLLCKKAGKMVVEYSLKNINKPIGVSEYQLTEKIPAALKDKLPSIKQIENELNDFT